MLQMIREKAQGWFTWVLITFICFTFALWGIHNYMGSNPNNDAAAKVNGVKITKTEYMQAYRRLRDQQAQLYGNKLVSNELIEQQLKNQALEQLIMDQVLVQSSLKDGFRVSDQEVTKVLESIPDFQLNGQFSLPRFRQILQYLSMSEVQFFEQLRNQLMLAQAQQGIITTAFALDTDVDAVIKLAEQKRDIGFLVIPLDRFNNSVKISEEMIQDFYTKNAESFKTPEQVSVEYVELTPDSIVKEKGSKKHFEDYREQLANLSYENPESLQPVAEKMKLKIKTSELFSQHGAEKGIAKNPDVVRAAFSNDVLRNGYNSEVIELNSEKLIVIRKAKHQPSRVKSIVEVKDEVKTILAQDQKAAQASDLANNIMHDISMGKPAKQVAKQHGLQWNTKQNISQESDDVNSVIIQTAFQAKQPADNHPALKSARINKDKYAVVAVTKVIDGSSKNLTNDQLKDHQSELAENYGKLDYSLYVKSLSQHAKIERVPQE